MESDCRNFMDLKSWNFKRVMDFFSRLNLFGGNIIEYMNGYMNKNSTFLCICENIKFIPL